MVDLVRHQFVGHRQSAMLEVKCSMCGHKKPRRRDFTIKSVECSNCGKLMCCIDGCSETFTKIGEARHYSDHEDPYKCSCGRTKVRNSMTGDCDGCDKLHCLYGHCTAESVSVGGIKKHQNVCKSN